MLVRWLGFPIFLVSFQTVTSRCPIMGKHIIYHTQIVRKISVSFLSPYLCYVLGNYLFDCIDLILEQNVLLLNHHQLRWSYGVLVIYFYHKSWLEDKKIKWSSTTRYYYWLSHILLYWEQQPYTNELRHITALHWYKIWTG